MEVKKRNKRRLKLDPGLAAMASTKPGKPRRQRKKELAKPVSLAGSVYECGYCGRVRRILYHECDVGWEIPPHPDATDRPVCYECFSPVAARDNCLDMVLYRMRVKLAKAGKAASEVSDLVHRAWRVFFVVLDHEALLTWATKLRVKANWSPEDFK